MTAESDELARYRFGEDTRIAAVCARERRAYPCGRDTHDRGGGVLTSSTTSPMRGSAERPAPGPARPYHFPHFERATLGNGLAVIVVPVRKLPVVTVSLLSDAGATAEPAGQEGVARLTARALMEGTKARTGDALTEGLERLGASLDADAEWDSGALSMTVLTSRLSDAMALVAEVMLEPAFPERELERLKAERLAEILQRRAEPRGLADDMFARFLYADDRDRPPDGGPGRRLGDTSDRVDAFHSARYRPGARRRHRRRLEATRLRGCDALRGWPSQRAVTSRRHGPLSAAGRHLVERPMRRRPSFASAMSVFRVRTPTTSQRW